MLRRICRAKSKSTPRLQPRRIRRATLQSQAFFLTNADIDHALGLLLLRQQETPLVVYASDETRAALGWIDDLLATILRN